MTLLDADKKIERDPILGEDTWELFEAVEHSFGVDLDDYYALCGMTVEQLADEIGKKASYPIAENCLSAASFYKLRRAFAEILEVPRATIRPSSHVSEVLPWVYRSRRRWRSIEKSLGLKMPGLAYPQWALIVSLATPAALLVSLRVFLGFPLNAIAIFGGSVLLFFPAMIALIPMARVLPPGSETFGGLAKLVLARNYTNFAILCGGSRKSDVILALRQIVAMQVVINLEEVSPETRIPQDLNIY